MKTFGEYTLHEYLKEVSEQYHFVVKEEEKIPRNVVFFSDGITGYQTLLLVGGGILFALSLGIMVLFEGIFANRGTGFLILMFFFEVFVLTTIAILGMTLYREGKLWLTFIQRKYKYGVFFMNKALICRGDEKIFIFPYKDIDNVVLETELQRKPKAKNYFIRIEYYDGEDKPYNFRLPLGSNQKVKTQNIIEEFKKQEVSVRYKNWGYVNSN